MEKEEKNIIGIVTAGALAFLASVEEAVRTGSRTLGNSMAS